MSKNYMPCPGAYSAETLRQARVLDQQCAQWRSVAYACEPGKSADHIVDVQQQILRRARKLGEMGPVAPQKIAEYFLKVSARWLFANTPVEKIVGKLPKTLDDLGLFIMTEGAPDSGNKLTGAELKRASTRGGKLIQ